MANLTGTGVPGRTTQAAIGDIYTDTTTGEKYKCVFAYSIDADKDYITQWKGLKENPKVNINPKEVAENVVSNHSQIKEEATVDPSPEPGVDNVEEETTVKPEQQKHKNYTNYSKAKVK